LGLVLAKKLSKSCERSSDPIKPIYINISPKVQLR
jgi:hypothetical protein